MIKVLITPLTRTGVAIPDPKKDRRWIVGIHCDRNDSYIEVARYETKKAATEVAKKIRKVLKSI